MRHGTAVILAAVLLGSALLSLESVSPPFHSFAQEKTVTQMDRPIWTVGSRWVQSVQRRRQGLQGREVQTLTRIDDFEGVRAYFLKFETEWVDAQGGRRIERFTKIRDMDLTPIAILDASGKVVLRTKGGWLKWPLVVGESWSLEGSQEFLGRTGWTKERVTEFNVVKSVGETTVAAGVFTAFQVNTVFRYSDSQGQSVGHGVEDNWISPEARIWVKHSFQGSNFSEDDELIEYNLAP